MNSPESLEFCSIEALIPYELNNKKHSQEEVDRLANSINEFGYTYPILVDEKNVILAGHKRLLASKKLGMEKVPVLRKTGLTETQKKAYRIIDNKASEESSWDEQNLALEMKTLEELGFQMDNFILDDFLSQLPEEAVSGEEDDFNPSLERTVDIELGDVITLGDHILICGDCTSLNDVAKAVRGRKVSMIITDPPYGVSYVGKTKEALEIENDNLDEDKLADLWSECLDAWLPHLNEGGGFCATVPAGPLGNLFANELHFRKILRQQLVWNKDSMVLGHSDYHYKHEPILYGWKPGGPHYFTPDRTKTSVLDFARPKRSLEHPTMKPLTLWVELIGNSSRADDLIADPFSGSGTTLLACEQAHRKFCGTEIDPRFCQVTIDRYQLYCDETGKEFVCLINDELYVRSK